MGIKITIVLVIIVYSAYVFHMKSRRRSSIKESTSDNCDCSKCNLKCNSRK